MRIDARLGEVKPVLAQATELRELLCTLLLDARDALGHGGVLHLSTRPERDGASVTLTHALGDEEARTHDPATPSERATTLAAARDRARRWGGDLLVDSRNGRMTVRLLLPAAPSQAKPAPSGSRPAARASRRVLVVDDDAGNRESLTELLALSGYDVYAAASGAAALGQVERTPGFDAALVDLAMPDMDGLELGAKAARRHAGDAQIACWSRGGAEHAARRARIGRRRHSQAHRLPAAILRISSTRTSRPRRPTRPRSPPRLASVGVIWWRVRIRPLVPLFAVVALACAGILVRRAQSATPPLPTLPPEGGLTFEVRDADGGALIPCKLTLVGVDGTPSPRFTKNDIGKQEGDGTVEAYDRILSLAGVGVAHVPNGTYDVYVSRGPEWDLAIQRKVRITSKGAVVQARLKHVVLTPGWLSADFHVHASHSSDSHVPMHDRIFEFVSDGVELITSTDHNTVSDYAPVIGELGAGKYITSLVGDELTTAGWGHFGAWPLPHELESAGQGAVLVHGRGPKDFFGDVRTHAPEAVIDVHHPRLDNEIGYFNIGGFDARNDNTAALPGFSFSTSTRWKW